MLSDLDQPKAIAGAFEKDEDDRCTSGETTELEESDGEPMMDVVHSLLPKATPPTKPAPKPKSRPTAKREARRGAIADR